MTWTKTGAFRIPILLLWLLPLLLVSCDIGSTRIGDIVGHPRDYAGKEVTVSGEVVEGFSLFIVKYFMVRDNSGEIAVVTDKPLPVKGEKVRVRGTVKEAFSIGTTTALVLVEASDKNK